MRVTGLTSQQGKTTKILITEVMAVELTSGKYIISRAIWLSCPGGGGLRCSSEILNEAPKGDRSGRGPSFFLTPKRDEKIYRSNIYF